METLLELNHINFTYHSLAGETFALSNIDFSLHHQEFLAIVGPSGCGKSTLLSLITGLIKPAAGTILLQGKPLEQSAHPPIGYMLQKDQLLEWQTIEQNVMLGLRIQHRMTEENKLYATALLKLYDLYDFKDAKPHELSGGMRQRAALIRTLVLDPELLLLDEPFSALDYQTRLKVSNDIGNIIRNNKKAAILVTHDLAEAISLADRTIVLSNRPATIKADISTPFDPELSPLMRRGAAEFKTYFNQIWEALNDER